VFGGCPQQRVTFAFLHLKKMRNITSLQQIEIFDTHGFPRELKLTANWDWDEAWSGICQCPWCGESDPDLQKGGWSHRMVKDRPVGLHSLEIYLRSQRYKCLACGRSFGSTHPGIKPNSNLTTRLVTHLAVRARGHETQARIARHTGVPAGTVRKCFTDHLSPPERLPDEPKALGIDQLHVGKGDPTVVITALGGRQNFVYDVLENDNVERVKGKLNDIEPAQRPLPVVIDMSTTFRDAARQARVPIMLIIDRYHLARKANRALGNARKELIGPSSEQDWETRKANIYNKAEAPNKMQGRLSIGKEPVDQMAAVYKAVLWFQHINTANELSREQAAEKLDEWDQAVKPPIREYFEETLTETLTGGWRDQILNYYEQPYTNGYNEGINNLGKKLDRIGASYGNEALKAKLRHSQAPDDLRDRRKNQQPTADTPRPRMCRAVDGPGPLDTPGPSVEEAREGESLKLRSR
jgi:transposase